MEYNEKLFDDLKYILKDYKTRQTKKCIFDSISDLFYRENYHSDIIAFYFSYDLSKKILINWINRTIKDETSSEFQKMPLRFEDYKNGSNVIREDGRRDITIFSNNQKNAIIIENKSNDAGDMDHQLIRYVRDLESKDKSVDAILYLNKDVIKEPDMSNWTEEEKQTIRHLTLCTKLIGKDSFTENVINPILAESTDIRLSALSLEIKDLFYNIVTGGNKMNETEMKDFMELLCKNDNLNELKKIIQAYNEFPEKSRDYYYSYLQQCKTNKEITDKCRIGRYSSNCLFVDSLIIDGHNFGVDFWFYPDYLDISLLVRNDKNWIKACEKLRTKMGNDWIFNPEHEEDHRYVRSTKVIGIEEDKVKNELKTVINSFTKYLD